jgi:ABC-type cobalamin/Fe3+-siderophores transport system ATPase subunit
MIKKLHFQNLRCFKDFTLENITPVTLISGRNNSGKTTLLEGILLLYAHRAHDVFFKLSRIRGNILNTQMPALPQPQQVLTTNVDPFFLWETLFFNMDMTQALKISIEDDELKNSEFCMAKDNAISLSNMPNFHTPQGTIQLVQSTYILKTSYVYSGFEEIGRFALTPQGLTVNFENIQSVISLPFTAYLGPNIPLWDSQLPEWLGKIDENDEKSRVIDALRILDADITDIFLRPMPGIVDIYAKWKNFEPRPLRTLGDGINKLLAYLLLMIANPGGIFLLDEIETGFHYSFYPKLWELLADVAVKTKSQIIATTHSYECIAAYAEGVSKVNPSLLSYVRMGKEKDVIRPYNFTKDNLAFALEHDMEVR